MLEITVDTPLVDSTEALKILRYWQEGNSARPNPRHLKKFFDQGDLSTRIKVKNKWLYSKVEVEALFIKLINKK